MLSTVASVIGPYAIQSQFNIYPNNEFQRAENYSNHFVFENLTQHEFGRKNPLFQNDSYNPMFHPTEAGANQTFGSLAKAIDVGGSSNSTNGTIDVDYHPQIPAYIRTTSMVFCIIIMCLGVVGNVMVPIVIMKTKDMRNSTNIFLMNLSIADLMVLLVCTPTVLVEVNTRPETWVLGKEMCLAVPFVELTVAHASVLTILAISFERYYAICEPLKAGYVCTKTRAALICFLAWFVAAVFTSPILGVASYEFVDYFDGSIVPVCLTQADSFWPALYFVTTISVFFLIPLAILIILYTIIAKNLMENPGIINQSNKHHHVSGSHLRYRKQVVMMLGTVVLSFFVCLLPFRALTLWIVIVPPENLESLGVDGYYSILYFCRIMLYINSAINPILYNLMSSKFRDGFLRLLRLNKFKKLHRFRKGDNIQRKDTFNTTTSTNYSSSQHTTDSFWRRLSNRNTSQKSPQKISSNINGIARKSSQTGGDQIKRPVPKVSGIKGVQNNRRNSMRFVSDVILIPKEEKANNEVRNANLHSYLEKTFDEISSDVIIETVDILENVDEKITLERVVEGDTSQDIIADAYSKDAIVVEGLGSGEKKTHFVRVPPSITKNASSTVSKGCVSHFAKESFV